MDTEGSAVARRAASVETYWPAGEVYSEIAGLWCAKDRQRWQNIESTARRVVNALRDGGRVLDVGCGGGAHLAAVRMLARDEGKRVSLAAGVDLAEAMIERASIRRGVRALQADALSLPFGDHVFDVVLVNHVLHLVNDPERAAREILRVAVPGGTIICDVPGRPHPALRGVVRRLPRSSLLRRYLELPRTFGVATFRRTLEELRCEVRETNGPRGGMSLQFLASLARWSATPQDLEIARELERRIARGEQLRGRPGRLLTVRVPGPRWGRMPIVVRDLPGWSPQRVERVLNGLPRARGYRLLVKPLRYRKRPHVQAFCEFDERRIIVQVPQPWRAFSEYVPYRAQRVRAKGFRFRWYGRRLYFERPDELIRYLYLHEYYHWYLREAMGKASGAETACDRFALQRLGPF
jgi:ubiquinone/menaquinone biosynthesis C-methylase UbiE